MNPGKPVSNNDNDNDATAFHLPKGYTNTLHISSTNTVQEVIEALLKKFLVADKPAKFALYKRCHKEDQGMLLDPLNVSDEGSNFMCKKVHLFHL